MHPSFTVRLLRQLRVRQLFRWWGARSLAASALSYGLDVAMLLACAKVLGLSTSLSVIAGATVGWVSSFYLNRRFGFRQHHAPLAPQALRFTATALGGMLIQSWFVGIAVNRFDAPLLLAKFGVDACVFSIGLPLAFRYFVFARKTQPLAPIAVPKPEAERL
ncbi:MAG: GtrA family protein [Myxococcaceae bacterium]